MDYILFEQIAGVGGDIGLVTLNRPKALNALSLEMVEALYSQLTVWQSADEIKAVVLRSSSDKAFCAGGDVRWLYETGRNDREKALSFFHREYQLNCLIHQFEKPYISFLDGLTMGGGVGISLHGNTPIATENFSFAMPETAIGFFPDVGGGYLLSRCLAAIGMYLALSGRRISRSDAMFAGLITHALDANDLDNFFERLCATRFIDNGIDSVNALLSEYQTSCVESKLEAELEAINDVFNQPNIASIKQSLRQSNTSFSEKTLASLQKKSPLSLYVSFEQIKRAALMTMEDSMVMEYRMVREFMQQTDFYEGVRALLIDKDNNPQWAYRFDEDINDAEIASYFSARDVDLIL